MHAPVELMSCVSTVTEKGLPRGSKPVTSTGKEMAIRCSLRRPIESPDTHVRLAKMNRLTQRGTVRLGHVSERVKRSAGVHVREVTMEREMLARTNCVRAIRSLALSCNVLPERRNTDVEPRGQLAVFSPAFRGGGFRCAFFATPARLLEAQEEHVARAQPLAEVARLLLSR